MDLVFSIFSVTKAATNVLAFRAIEFPRPVRPDHEDLPTSSRNSPGGPARHITLYDLLTDIGSMPSLYHA